MIPLLRVISGIAMAYGCRLCRLCAAAGALLVAALPAAGADLAQWPGTDDLSHVAGAPVTFPSHSPFTLWDVGKGEALDPPTEAQGMLFLPPDASFDAPVPAVILLHEIGRAHV